MAGILPPRIWTQQPNQAVPIVWPDGITPIAAYNAANGFVDCSGASMTRGSAANIGAGKSGLSIKQTAVNTSVYRPIVGLPSVLASYMAVWSGDFVGAPTGGTAKICGISNTASSQSGDLLGIERGSTADHIQVVGKIGGTGVIRDINVGASAWYGKRVTLVLISSIQESIFRLFACVDGVVSEYSSAYTGSASPTILGTERLVIGADIVENASRFANVNAALAAFACGAITTNYARSVAANPWQIFAPVQSNVFAAISAGGGGSTNLIVADSSHSHIADSIALSWEALLSVSDASHGHAADNATLGVTGSTDLVIADSEHSHVADNITLSWEALLAIADSAHSHAADNVTLDASNSIQLTTQDATHAHAADAITLSADSWLSVADATHAHSADSITFGSALTDAEKIDLILDILSNRQTIDPLTGIYTLYADDGVTTLKTAAAWEDAAGTIPYRGQGLQRLDAMQ